MRIAFIIAKSDAAWSVISLGSLLYVEVPAYGFPA